MGSIIRAVFGFLAEIKSYFTAILWKNNRFLDDNLSTEQPPLVATVYAKSYAKDVTVGGSGGVTGECFGVGIVDRLGVGVEPGLLVGIWPVPHGMGARLAAVFIILPIEVRYTRVHVTESNF